MVATSLPSNVARAVQASRQSSVLHLEPLQLAIFIAVLLGGSVGVVVVACVVLRGYVTRREQADRRRKSLEVEFDQFSKGKQFEAHPPKKPPN